MVKAIFLPPPPLHTVNPAIVTDIRQADDICSLVAETQVSVKDDDGRQHSSDGWVRWKVTRQAARKLEWRSRRSRVKTILDA